MLLPSFSPLQTFFFLSAKLTFHPHLLEILTPLQQLCLPFLAANP
jgi:hypothetical protein